MLIQWKRIAVLCAVVVAGGASRVDASVIGHSQQGPPLTVERVRADVPAREQSAWLAYLQRSSEAMHRDKSALAHERSGMSKLPPLPSSNPGTKSMPMDKDAAWYASAEARHIADVIVSFQTRSGGWGKNIDLSGPLRQRGQSYVSDNENKLPSPGDLDLAPDPAWHYVGTIDNDATVTQIRFLARVQATAAGKDGEAYRKSLQRGVEYLLAAQFPNGGWPQVWPMEGGYHDALTFNDDALINVTEVLQQAASGKGDYAFVSPRVRTLADKAVAKAFQCILRAQVVVEAKRTIWAQQYDPLTLQPVAARNYEPASLASGESAQVLLFLMKQPLSAEQKSAVGDGVAWLQGHAVRGYEWTNDKKAEGGRRLIEKPGGGPIWARYYSMQTGKPVFGDRDLSIHDNVNEISLERRNGYAWYNSAPLAVIQQYESLAK